MSRRCCRRCCSAKLTRQIATSKGVFMLFVTLVAKIVVVQRIVANQNNSEIAGANGEFSLAGQQGLLTANREFRTVARISDDVCSDHLISLFAKFPHDGNCFASRNSLRAASEFAAPGLCTDGRVANMSCDTRHGSLRRVTYFVLLYDFASLVFPKLSSFHFRPGPCIRWTRLSQGLLTRVMRYLDQIA